MAAAADATTAMTIDFLRARLLSERSVSRAAKERTDHLANRVAELEEQLRTVTAQRRKADRAAAEVLAILDSQGFGRLSDAADSGSDDDGAGGPESPEHESGGEEAEDALSGSEAGAPQPGGLSWKGRAASSDSDRWQPHHKARQLRQRHGHSHRRSSYVYSLAADSSPKYQRGQSCRKIKRKELRLHTEDEDGKANVAEGLEEEEEQQRSECTDEQRDLDGDVSQDGRGSSSGDGRVQDGNERYTVEYEKDGEMERVLEKQAQLIGQYEAEEYAQREWEKKFSGRRDSTLDDIDRDNKLNQNEKAWELMGRDGQIKTKEVGREEAQSRGKDMFGINSPLECLLNGSASARSSNTPEVRATGKCEESDNDFGRATAVVASVDSQLHVRKDELAHKSYAKTIEGSVYNTLGRSTSSPQRSYNNILNAGYKGQGGRNSDSGSNYHANARSYEHYGTTSSVGSPLSDTPKSKMSEWSSSCLHNHTDNQIDMHPHQLSSDDVGGVLDALQRAKMSLMEKLSRASPVRQDMLALPAPEDHYIEDDLQFNDTQLSLCMSLSQEISALPASSGDYLSMISLPGDDAKVPVGPSGLFRLPTDSFPQNEVCSTDGYGSKFSLTSSQQTIFSRNPASHMMSASSLSRLHTGGDASFIPKILRCSDDSRRAMPECSPEKSIARWSAVEIQPWWTAIEVEHCCHGAICLTCCQSQSVGGGGVEVVDSIYGPGPRVEVIAGVDLELLGNSDAATTWRTIVEEQAATWTFGRGDDRFGRRPGPPPLRTSPYSSTPAAGGSTTANVSCLTWIVEEAGRAQALGSSVEEDAGRGAPGRGGGGGGAQALGSWRRWACPGSLGSWIPARAEAEIDESKSGSTDSKTERVVLSFYSKIT